MASVEDSSFKQLSVIEFLVHENESVVNIHKRLCAVYGSCAVDRSTVGWWAKKVKASGSAETELRYAIIRADRLITTRRLALQISISTGNVFSYWEMLLQHDNARPHTRLRTREQITKMGWTMLPHPPYSPDLAPLDFHLSERCFAWNSLWRWQRNWSCEEVATQAGQELVPARNTCTCSALA
jgi:hypothetical protein